MPSPRPSAIARSPRPKPRGNHWALGLGLALLAGDSLALGAAALPARWRWSNPAPLGANIFDMAYGFGLTVAVAERGQIFTSDDLGFWEPRESGTTNSLRAVTFFGSRLVITGERGIAVYADSLGDFHPVDLGTGDWLEGLAASTDLLVAVGDNGAIYTSRSGAEWARQPSSITAWLTGVAWGQDLFVAVGERGLIATSPNGTNWTKRTSNTTRNLKRVSWMKNQFWAVGDQGLLLTSSTGTANWTSANSGATNTLFDAEAAGLDQLVLGDSEVRLRRGGAQWSNELNPTSALAPPAWTYYNAEWEDPLFLLSGRSGLLIEGFQTNLAAPYLWVERRQSVRNWLWDLKRTPEFYVTVGFRGTVMTSVDGIDWDLELVPDAVTNITLFGVGGTTNLLLAVGENGNVILSPNVLTNVVLTNADLSVSTNPVSTLGIFWNPIPPPTTNALQGVTTFGDRFVLTGDNGTVLLSDDGTRWVPQDSGTTNFLTGVAEFPGGLVAVGRGGTLLTSPDGNSWTSHPTGTTNWLYRVRYLGGRLIVIGQNGTVLTSPDGSAWTRQAPGGARWLTDVTLLHDTYFVAGTLGTILASTNAVDWTYLGTITEKSLYGIACHQGQLVAAGVEGAIVRAQVIPDMSPVRFLAFSQRTNLNAFLLSGKPDQRFTLDRTPHLAEWTPGPLLEFLDSSGTLLLLDNSTTNRLPTEFFRATVVP